ncbi:hypothetical protein FGO68_gene6343 [Halteria grandinella]|uniref:Uncharacterized protein n=1 Tax=Halteria grandinella TaxID=5974 RepID=A0A8J8NXA6_HALGN|nr:hypothetical protein FGO68_gene6343 [Halteria grandinella]
MLGDMKNNWMRLIEKESKLYEKASTIYNPQKDMIQLLEAQALNHKVVFTGRFLHRDMERFIKFHEEFKEYISMVRQYSTDNNVFKLHSLKARCTSLSETIQREFEYLAEIGKPNFVFDNYKSCIEKCPIPFKDQIA